MAGVNKVIILGNLGKDSLESYHTFIVDAHISLFVRGLYLFGGYGWFVNPVLTTKSSITDYFEIGLSYNNEQITKVIYAISFNHKKIKHSIDGFSSDQRIGISVGLNFSALFEQ